MKYPVEAYSKAFCEAALEHKGKDAVLTKNFLAAVRKNGDWGQIRKIVEAVAKRSALMHGGRYVSVEFGRTPDEKTAQKLRDSFKKADHVEFKVNASLVAGARILINGERELDSTLIRKINKLFT